MSGMQAYPKAGSLPQRLRAGDPVTFILTRTLPDGQEKTSIAKYLKRGGAAKEAARAHHDNIGGGRPEMDAVYEALMTATPGETVGPFDGYHYRIDKGRS